MLLSVAAAVATPTIAAADPVTHVKLPAAKKADDDGQYLAFWVESVKDGKHTIRIEFQDLQAFSIYCEEDASECRNNGLGSETKVRTNDVDDPNALKKLDDGLDKNHWESVASSYVAITGDATVKVGDITVSFPAADEPNSFMMTINGKKAMKTKLAGPKAKASIKGVAMWHGWLLFNVYIESGKNWSTTWDAEDIRGYK
nr:hypothetical protein [Kofleriaceae bacterium]